MHVHVHTVFQIPSQTELDFIFLISYSNDMIITGSCSTSTARVAYMAYAVLLKRDLIVMGTTPSGFSCVCASVNKSIFMCYSEAVRP